jgi:hypothetical protein
MLTNRSRAILGVFFITAVVGAVYWRSLYLPFIQDDWGILRFIQANGPLTVLQQIFSFEHKLFYRPLAQGYLLLMYQLVGPNPLFFHSAALVLHLINTCLVGLILNLIIRDRVISYLSALIYAAAVAIHLEPLAWAVGIYDLGGAFFFLLCIWLFLKDKLIASAVALFCGSFFKEAVVTLPLILLFHRLLLNPTVQSPRKAPTLWRQIIPFLLVVGMVGAVKLAGESPFAFPATHPYVISLTGGHLIRNLFGYLYWMSQSCFPWLSLGAPLFWLVASTIAFILLLGVWSVLQLQSKGPDARRLLFMIIWLFTALLPVLFLPNHAYRYYAVYSLPAFVGIILLLLKNVLLFLRLRERAIIAVLAACASCAVIGSAIQADRIYREGIDYHTLADGTNSLIRRAAFVAIVRRGLAEQLPNIPPGSEIVIGGADLWSFDKNSGPQFWYHDGTIRLYELGDLGFDDGRPYIQNPIESQVQTYTGSTKGRIYLDPLHLFIFKVLNGRLIAVNPKELE